MRDLYNCSYFPELFKRQSHEMVKHTQTIRRQQRTNCVSVFDHFMGLVLRGLNVNLYCLCFEVVVNWNDYL